MAFGRGILAPARRIARDFNALEHPPFGLVVSLDQSQPQAVVIVPEGTRPFQTERTSDQVRFSHELYPFDAAPRYGETGTLRTLITDARDLLVQTLFERTAFRTPDGRLAHSVSPMLPCIVERRGMWADPEFYTRYPRKYIHIGKTSLFEELLQSPLLRPLHESQGWDGRLASLDADGYVVASITDRNGTRPHILLAGGRDYGTYYAVASFLKEFAGARWIFPGPLGTVIPRNPLFSLDRAFYRVEEPDYRGRNLVAMVEGAGIPFDLLEEERARLLRNSHTPEEVNETRNWLLRNRLHSTDERRILLARRPVPYGFTAENSPDHPDNANCQSLSPVKRKYLRVESRIPVGHGLSRFFSPNVPSLDPDSFGAGMRPRLDVLPEMYPDSRPLLQPELNEFGVGGRQPALRGQSLFCVGPLTPSPLSCPVAPSTSARFCECPIEDRAQELVLRSDTSGRCIPLPSVKLLDGFRARFSEALTPRHNVRFIPRTTRRAHHQDSVPREGWIPCLFETPPERTEDFGRFENPLAVFRETVAVDLAHSLIGANVMHHQVWGSDDPEFCDSLGADDGEGFWCECTPCRSTNGTDGNGSVVYQGFTILANLVRFEEIGGNDWLSQDLSRLGAQAEYARQTLQEAHAALRASPLSSARFLEAVLGWGALPGLVGRREALVAFMDRMALRGVIPDRARLYTHTRRLLVLMNRAAFTLAASSRDSGNPLYIHFDHTLLTFLTYLDYTAPPIFGVDPQERAEEFYPVVRAEHFHPSRGFRQNSGWNVLHPFLTPMISGSRDLLEYEQSPEQVRGMSPFAQHRIAPEQFNHRRWSMIAQQTGIYEWMYGRTTLAPRLYTRRLKNALQGAYEQYRARVFLAEAEPHMGLDGVKFYELAELLWNTRRTPREIREEYCRALFGPQPRLVDLMIDYFNLLETVWCDREVTRTTFGPLEHRYSSGFVYGTFMGYGIMGRSGWPTELEPFMRTPAGGTTTQFALIWQKIQAAFELSLDEPEPLLKERVQYFRRALGLIGELIRVYRPILDAWQIIERWADPLAADPLEWAQMPVGNSAVTAWTIGGVAASRIPVAARMRLGDRLAPAGVLWARSRGFRSEVREPIHRYLAGNSLNIEGLGRELGLGLSQVPYVADGRIELDASAPGAMRHAFYLPYVRQYVAWWHRDDVRRERRTEAASSEEAKAGLGATWFLSAKNVVAAMMIIGSQRGSDGMDRPFSAVEIGDFFRDA
jgi:hypothetical protein